MMIGGVNQSYFLNYSLKIDSIFKSTIFKENHRRRDNIADWITSLQTDTRQQGFELAITLARKGVAYTQPSAEIRAEIRDVYAKDADSLTMASQVVATHFQTVAAANNYWK